MTKLEVLEFSRKFPAVWMATVEDDKPHVRGMMMWFADETGFYFHTASCKRLAQQMQKNPNMELAFFDPGSGPGAGRMLRISGKAEEVTSPVLTERLYKERPWVEGLAKNMPAGSRLVIFRLGHAQAEFWNMAVNGREGEQAKIVL
ncbi:MAG: pyridoxamine 5'-phosphate oxidase family protein [Lentisphaerota bacterium]